MDKKTLPIVIGLLIVFGAGFFLYQHNAKPVEEKTTPVVVPTTVPEGAHVILLTKDGYEPAVLTIKKGETIAFTTNTGIMFWPASNLHPSHQIYPEFDPMQPVQPDAAWSFTFEKAGEWKFHDHLSPYFTGVITVTE